MELEEKPQEHQENHAIDFIYHMPLTETTMMAMTMTS
jgi:hypothetical protein